MRPRIARLKSPLLEVLLFQAGGVRYGVTLGNVVGLVRDLPDTPGDDAVMPRYLHFEGRTVPVFPASDFLQDIGPVAGLAGEAIILDDGAGPFGLAVDCTESVVEVTPGTDLYIFPPTESEDPVACRAWGVLTVAERPVLLLDVARVGVH